MEDDLKKLKNITNHSMDRWQKEMNYIKGKIDSGCCGRLLWFAGRDGSVERGGTEMQRSNARSP